MDRSLGTLVAVVLVGCSSVGRVSAVVPGIGGPRAEPPSAQSASAQAPRVELSQAPEAAPQGPELVPPTWATIYARYFGPGTEGSCGAARGCHADAMADADSAYQWLAQRGYISGATSPLVRSNSCLRWFGGNMPPRGSLPNEEATRDLGAWAAAGARNN